MIEKIVSTLNQGLYPERKSSARILYHRLCEKFEYQSGPIPDHLFYALAISRKVVGMASDCDYESIVFENGIDIIIDSLMAANIMEKIAYAKQLNTDFDSDTEVLMAIVETIIAKL